MMPVVILCGGFGTRLRTVVSDTPKVLAPVNGRPFLAYVIDHLRSQGLGESIWLSTGYLADQVAEFAKSVNTPEQRVRCIAETQPLGTGGALRFAAVLAGIEGPFLAMNGDTWFDAPLRTLAVESMVRENGQWVVALTPMQHADRYGTVDFDPATRQVNAFVEKHPIGDDTEWINAGAYLAWTDTLRSPDLPEAFSLEQYLFPQLQQQGKLYARAFPNSRFLDIGIPEDYAKAEDLFP
jgi:D-glycero-alpha-D-manno-heptose 1-phosphate guanylyltransferase